MLIHQEYVQSRMLLGVGRLLSSWLVIGTMELISRLSLVQPLVDEHSLHFLTHRRLCLTEEFKALPDTAQNVMFQHMLQHKQDQQMSMMVPQAPSPPSPQSAMTGGAGPSSPGL